MPRPHLTMVIPTHHGAESLVPRLHALRAGTRPPDEIIVVDDASTCYTSAFFQLDGFAILAHTPRFATQTV